MLLGEQVDQDSADPLEELSSRLTVERFQTLQSELFRASPGRVADVAIPIDDRFKGEDRKINLLVLLFQTSFFH